MEKWKKWWSIEEVIRARAEALVHNGKSAVMGRGPEIGFQNVEAEIVCTESEIISRDPEIISTPLNVEISAEQVIVPVEQEALNQSQLSRTLLQQFLLLVVSTRPNTEDEEDAEPPRTAGRASTHRVDRRRRFETHAISNGVRSCSKDAEKRRAVDVANGGFSGPASIEAAFPLKTLI
ncbi:hypothetical protein EVAR_75342_1 [Eumeta japonica]|uniref:Uncharacterized protein n=1 Tax=Eumeta variegata TaxID=151549 RepID=A0A4C1XYP2_EUMVA|nr:hypothetical protein EVAR_75342_1 [Eumeta japonica]